MKKIYTAALITAALIAPASSGERPLLAVLTGYCVSQLPGAHNPVPCDSKAVFAVAGNGRVFVQFIIDGGRSVSFNGGRDRQSGLNHYSFDVDTVRLWDGGKEIAQPSETKGECSMTLSNDATAFYSVHCDASDGYSFHLDDIVKTVTEGAPK